MVDLRDCNLLGGFCGYDDFLYWARLQFHCKDVLNVLDFVEGLNAHALDLARQHGIVHCRVQDISRPQLVPHIERAVEEGVFRVEKYHRDKKTPTLIVLANN